MNSLFKNLYSNLSKKTVALIDRAKLTEHTFMIIIAIVIGILAGFAAIGIRMMIEEISALSYSGDGTLLDNIINSPWYIKVLIPALGGLIVGPLIYFFAPEAKGHGVPEVMQSILLKGGKIRPRVAVIKAFASAVTIGTGGSVGREGPIIQIGSSLGSAVAQFFRIPPKRMKTLVGCGAAAGIAAAFNAPIAGALFALEIILMDFAVAQFSPIVISSVMATVISHQFEGNFAAFIVPSYELASPYEIGFYFVLGAVSGLVSWVFIKVLYFSEDYFDYKFNFPEYLKPIIGGLAIGSLALIFPQIMGVGYDTINLALHGNLVWDIALILIFVKIFATSVTLGTGGSGGIFAPSLFMGATLGAFFGAIVNYIFPEITASPGAYALVAMGGLVAGTTRAPITAIIIVFELTNDYNIILPLMITCIISTILSSKLSRESIYTLKLLLRNINIKEGAETNIMESIQVKEVLNKKSSTILANDNFSVVVNKVLKGKGPEFPVVTPNNTLIGLISLNELKEYLFERDSLRDLLIATDITNHNFEVVTPDENCQAAIDKMRKADLESLPVVSPDNNNVLVGTILLTDIQDAYQKELNKREITENLADKISMSNKETNIQFIEGYSIAEVPAPNIFVGKSIREINIRAKYGVDVLSIKQPGDERGAKIKAIPNPDHIIEANEKLVVAGEIKNINRIKHLE